jgi:hypothetical protein
LATESKKNVGRHFRARSEATSRAEAVHTPIPLNQP